MTARWLWQRRSLGTPEFRGQEEVILSTGRRAAILRTKYPDVSLEETLRRHTTRITISKWMRAKLRAVNDQLKRHRHEHHPGVRAVAA